MKVTLTPLIDALRKADDGLTQYLDTRNGNIFGVTDEGIALAADKIDLNALSEDQKEAMFDARAVLAAPRGTYLELPALSEIKPHALMREFIDDLELDHPVAAEDLARAARSKDAPRRFRDTLATYGLGDTWNAFHDDALRQIVLAWCDENGIEADIPNT